MWITDYRIIEKMSLLPSIGIIGATYDYFTILCGL